jgi:catechol 2,3-dioxygenase-like lactoylglutathione lyase family enzyme
MTVNKLDESLSYYQEVLGFEVRDNAERKGEWIDRITGISNFHSRTVYLSISPYQDLELYEFYNPKTVPAAKSTRIRAGIKYCVYITEQLGKFTKLVRLRGKGEFPRILDNLQEYPMESSNSVVLRDPNGLKYRVIEPDLKILNKNGLVERELLYPVLLVSNMERCIDFYSKKLGLKIVDMGQASTEKSPLKKIGMKWVVFGNRSTLCLKLIQPLNINISAAYPWRMERVGFTHIAFAVNDIEKYYSKLRKRDVDFKSPPQSVVIGPHKGGKVVYLNTSEGISLELVESSLSHLQAKRQDEL